MHVKTLMTSPVPAIEADAPLGQARALMGREGLECLPVVREGRLVGTLSGRDLRRAGSSPAGSPRPSRQAGLPDRLAADVAMRRDVVAVAPNTSLADAARAMRAWHADGLPVLQGDHVVGLVTRRDLLGALVRMLEDEAPTRIGHILVPTDFGAAAARAVAAGADLAGRHRARLTLLHVIHLASWSATAEPLPADLGARLASQCRERCVERLRASAPPAPTASCVDFQVAEGEPATEIVECAVRNDADLIVMGTRGRGGLARLVLGSVAADVLRAAPCPVLVVKA